MELINVLLVDSNTVPNPFFQHKPTKCVSTCSHPLFAREADSIIVTFGRRWHITGSHAENCWAASSRWQWQWPTLNLILKREHGLGAISLLPYATSHLVCIASKDEEKEHGLLQHLGGEKPLWSSKETKSEMIGACKQNQSGVYWGGLVCGNLSGKAQRRRAQVETCLFTVIGLRQLRGQGAVPHQGAGGGRLECDRGMPDALPRRNNYRFQRGSAP